MQLLQWLIPLEGGGVASAITRREARTLTLPDAGGERRRGPIAESPDLSLPLTVGRPHDEPAGDGSPVRVLHLTLALLGEGQPKGAALLAADEDDVGSLSLFAEYAQALSRLVDVLELPLDWMSPTAGSTLELSFAALEGWGARRAAWTLLLLAGAADVLARARGFRVLEAKARADEGAWHVVDATLPGALAPA